MNKVVIDKNLTLEEGLILGPMAGFTDLTFRRICKEMGASLVFTEMVSAKGLTYKNQNTFDLLKTTPDESPVALQLFGHESEVMAEAVRMVEGMPFCMIDINMGCPVPKVVKSGEGSAMMLDPLNAASVVKAVKKATSKPVSVKIRKGFNKDDDSSAQFAKMLEDSGADMITIHGRTKAQGYSGKADLNSIKNVKEAVKIPVIGSGDIFDYQDAINMQEQTGVDNVMVARGARGNPWIFKDITPDINDKIEMILKHAKMQIESDGEELAMKKMRTYTGFYISGEHNAAKLRGKLSNLNNFNDLEEILRKYL